MGDEPVHLVHAQHVAGRQLASRYADLVVGGGIVLTGVRSDRALHDERDYRYSVSYLLC